MNSKEFRIGNYAQDQNGNLLQVVGLVDDDITFSVVDRSKYPLPDGWQAEPIPITAARLEMFGFALNNFYPEFRHKEAPIYFTVHPGRKNEFVCFVHQCSHGHIKFVHQLQNLYFTHTGVDLEIVTN